MTEALHGDEMKSMERKKKEGEKEEEKGERAQKRSLLKACIYMGDEARDKIEKNRFLFPRMCYKVALKSHMRNVYQRAQFSVKRADAVSVVGCA